MKTKQIETVEVVIIVGIVGEHGENGGAEVKVTVPKNRVGDSASSLLFSAFYDVFRTSAAEFKTDAASSMYQHPEVKIGKRVYNYTFEDYGTIVEIRDDNFKVKYDNRWRSCCYDFDDYTRHLRLGC